MICKTQNKPILAVSVFTILITVQSLVHGWVSPVDFNADNGTTAPYHRFTAAGSGTTYDRCDTPKNAYSFGAEPSYCHRWGLSFQYGKKDTVWTPKFDGSDYRLPTIKELVRLFNYTDGTGLDFLIKNMLGTVDENTWLISSSYRDIDGSYDAGTNGQGRLQIFALNALTGEVKTFEPGNKSSGSARLELCVSLASNGDCTLDSTSTTIHALKVSQTLLKDL